MELGIDRRAERLQRGERGEKQRELRGHRQAALADQRHHLDDKLPGVDFAQLEVVVLGDERRHVSLEPGDVDVSATSADLEQHIDGGGAVLLDDRYEQVGHLVACGVGQVAAPAEVCERHATIGQGEEVTGVWVGVIEAVDEDLLVVARDASPCDLHTVDAVGIELVEPVERDALDAVRA